jgi:hypothetical protein
MVLDIGADAGIALLADVTLFFVGRGLYDGNAQPSLIQDC